MVFYPGDAYFYCRVNATRMEGQDLASNIIRFDRNGEWDSAWSLWMDGDVTCLLALGNGKLLVGGTFSHVNGHTTSRVVRLNGNGSVDASFSVSGLPTNSDMLLDALSQGSDGVIYAGFFVDSGTSVYRIGVDGVTTPFASSVSSVKALAVDAAGAVYVGGKQLHRYQADGSRDFTFEPNFQHAFSIYDSEQQIYEIVLHNSYELGGDYIAVAGIFTKVNSTECQSLIALDTSGDVITHNIYSQPLEYDELFDPPFMFDAVLLTDLHVERDQLLCTGIEVNGIYPYLTFRSHAVEINLNSFKKRSIHSPSAAAGSGVLVDGNPVFGRSEFARNLDSTEALDLSELRQYDEVLLLKERGPWDLELRNGGGVIFYGSYLREVDGRAIPGLFALDENMQLDASFQPDFDRGIFRRMQRLPDGRMLAYGSVDSLPESVFLLNEDGTLVPDFHIPFRVDSLSSDLDNLWLMPTGKVLISGKYTLSGSTLTGSLLLDFNHLDEKLALAQTLPNGLVDAGLIDADFQDPGIVAFDAVGATDGSIIISVSSGHEMGLVRLLPNGSVDETYQGDAQFSSISKALLETDLSGRVYVAQRGYGSLGLSDGSSDKIVRLLPEGTLDSSFQRDSRHFYTRNIKYVGNERLLVGGGGLGILAELFLLDDNGALIEDSFVNVLGNAFNFDADGQYLYCASTDYYYRKIDWGRAQMSITLQPQSFITPSTAQLNEGDDITFWLADRGADESYQWLSNGSALPGQTGPSLTLDPTTLANAGEISVQATGPGGTVTRTARLGVTGFDFNDWGASVGLTPGELSDPDADPDGNGLSLNDEYLLRSDLGGPTNSTWASPLWDDEGLTLAFTMLPGRRYWIDCSTNLVDWTPIDSYTSDAAGPVAIELDFDPETPCFYQVRVELTSP